MVGYLPTANKKPLGAFGLGSLFRLENGKKQGSKRKILQFYLHTGFFSVSALEIIHCFSL